MIGRRIGQAQVLGLGIQVRTLKRKLAYPEGYRLTVPRAEGKKDHSSYFQRAIKSWLGPKNLRGEYFRNKYYYPPQDHKPRYIVQDGQTVVGAENQGQPTRLNKIKSRNSALQPFPDNLECKTASVISDDLKATIYEEVTEQGLKLQQVAQKYGIKLARVEAIVKLYSIEQNWKLTNKVTPELQKFSEVMYRMFPLYNPVVQPENLTEIPIPSRTLHQRFMTISESEPFGPVDAAKIFGLEPAVETLQSLTEIKDHHGDSDDVRVHKVVVGTQKEGDRNLFKFTSAKAGDVGFRYGASRRDRKKDRAIGFDRVGKLVYL